MIFVVNIDDGSVQVLFFSAIRDGVALLIMKPDYQLDFWNLHWSNFLVESLVVVECEFIWLVSPAWDAVELTLQG